MRAAACDDELFGAGLQPYLLARKHRGQRHRHVVDPLRRRARHVQPHFAVWPIHRRISRHVRADLVPARALVRIHAQYPRRLRRCLQHELRQRQIDDAILVQPHIHGEAPVLRRHRGNDVVAAVAALLHIGCEEPARRPQHRVSPFEELAILRVQVVPPQALHGPRRFAHLVTPRRHRIRVHFARHRVRRVEEERPRQPEFILRIGFAEHRQLLAQFDVRQVLLRVVRAEHAPPHLLGVVVHVVVAVPRRADAPAGPVAEQPRCHFALAQTARQEILVVIPDPLQFAVLEFNRRFRPERAPALRRRALQFVRRDG